METRLAKNSDLPNLKIMYKKIVENMNNNNINIWDEYYPYELFSEDIEKNSLYLLVNNNEIMAAFALNELYSNEQNLKWSIPEEKAVYINRVGVNVDYLKCGIGSALIKEAVEIVKKNNSKYLRLLVVDNNEPAIGLYIKNKFKQVEGIYEEEIDDDLTLIEYGFELKII
ncbi:MAG: GNAT family N-acetyltransferase [Mycoplasmatota bacterium]